MNEQSKTRLIRLPEVMDTVGLKRATIYKRIKAGEFPAPIKSGRASCWSDLDVQEWVRKQQQQAA